MAQIFGPATNTLAMLSLYVGAAAPFAILITGSQITQSPYNTKVGVPIDQPIPFSHRHHVWELGIDCRFCHTSVENSAHAGVPSSEVCMTCHSLIWTNSPNLQPVRKSYESNTPLQWNKVNKAPEFVYFNHSIHIAKGISCNTCHGAVEKQHITAKGRSFTMAWCLECHEAPEQYMYDDGDPKTSPAQQVFKYYDKISAGDKLTPVEQRLHDGHTQKIAAGEFAEGAEIAKARGINKAMLSDCWVCHR